MNKALTELLTYFLEHHRMYNVTAVDLFRFITMKRRARLALGTSIVLIVLALASIVLLNLAVPRYERSFITDILPASLMCISVVGLVVTVVRYIKISGWEWDTAKRAENLFQKSRAKFRKSFGRDIMRCSDVILLRIEVRASLVKKTREVLESRQAKKLAKAKHAEGEQGEMWDAGTEFVPIPSYREMYELAGKGSI